MFKTKRILISIILAMLLLIGFQIYRYQQDRNTAEIEMIQALHDKDVHAEIEKFLMARDPNALTSKGKIKSYQIDYHTAHLNPMGGIGFTVYVNDDHAISFSCILSKYGPSGIYGLSTSESNEFQHLVGIEKYE